MPFKYADPVERLIAHSVMVGECWIWTGAVNNVGRPVISVRINGKVKKITCARYIAQFIHGMKWGRNQSRRKVGAHSCDNGACVNVAHVNGSTQKQNIRECVARGRHYSPFAAAA